MNTKSGEKSSKSAGAAPVPSDADGGYRSEMEAIFAGEDLRWLPEATLQLPYIPDFLLRDVVLYFAPSHDSPREVMLSLTPKALDKWVSYFTKKGIRFLNARPSERKAEGPYAIESGGFRLEILEAGTFFGPKPRLLVPRVDRPLPITTIDKRRPLNPWKPTYIRAVNFIKKYEPIHPVPKVVEYCLYEVEECGEVSGSTSWENAELLLKDAVDGNSSVCDVLVDVFEKRPEDFPLGSEVYLRVVGESSDEGFRRVCALHEHPQRLKRRQVAVALGKLGRPDGIETLLKLVDDHEVDVRNAALYAISRVGISKDHPGFESIASLAESDDIAQRVWLAVALLRGGDASQEKTLINLVKEREDPLYNMGELGQVLQELGIYQAVPFLIKRLRSDRIELQDDAAEVLRELTGLDLEFHGDGNRKREAIKRWKGWWEEYKKSRRG